MKIGQPKLDQLVDLYVENRRVFYPGFFRPIANWIGRLIDFPGSFKYLRTHEFENGRNVHKLVIDFIRENQIDVTNLKDYVTLLDIQNKKLEGRNTFLINYGLLLSSLLSIFSFKSFADLGSFINIYTGCLLYTSPSPRDQRGSRMPSSA